MSRRQGATTTTTLARSAPRRRGLGPDGPAESGLLRAAPGEVLGRLKAIPEERRWLEAQRSPQTRRAYRRDLCDFLATVGIRPEQLRQVDSAAVLLWRRALEERGAKPASIRRKLAALSSLYTHLAGKQLVRENPVRDLPRPRIGRTHGTTAAFSTAEARALLEAPDPSTLQGLRDRAILAVGLQVGTRRSEVARLTVRDFHTNRGYDCLRFRLKGGLANDVAVHGQVSRRLRDYLARAGHAEDLDGPLFRPVRALGRPGRRHLHPDRIDAVLKHHARAIGIVRGYSAHSMRATPRASPEHSGRGLARGRATDGGPRRPFDDQDV